jgi:hypothetical protein
MTTQEIITAFELYVDDTTELSPTEELALAEKIYREILNDRPWSFLQKEATGSTSTIVPYVALPADFKYLISNNQYAGQFVDQNPSSRVVFVDEAPYTIINWSERKQYRDQDGYAYLDIPNSRLVFTKQPTVANTYEFDYIYRPDALTLNTSPIFDEDFHAMIYHGMAVEDDITQRFERARSYATENSSKYQEFLADLRFQDAQHYND